MYYFFCFSWLCLIKSRRLRQQFTAAKQAKLLAEQQQKTAEAIRRIQYQQQQFQNKYLSIQRSHTIKRICTWFWYCRAMKRSAILWKQRNHLGNKTNFFFISFFFYSLKFFN
jgi:hypothetical protein